MTKTLELTKQLVAIPSWVGAGCDEIKVGQFIYDWLSKNTTLKVVKQPVVGGRFNVIAAGTEPTRTVLVGHIDTVENRAGWITNPWTPVIKNDRLYGLGATDMKGSLAAMLTTVAEANDTAGLMILCYIDEEYDFAGMRAFIRDYGQSLRPDLVVSLDGHFGAVGTGCRGLIEVSFRLRGKGGHAGRPEAGVNAILAGVNCINKLKRQLATKYSDPELGITSLNLAYCQGGLDVGNNQYGRQGNNIADAAEFVLDIRPGSAELTADRVRVLLDDYVQAAKLTLLDWSVRHDLGAWTTPIADIKAKAGLGTNFETFSGYVDTQMIWDKCGQPTCLALGAGTSSVAHTTNEYVEIASLEKTYLDVSQIIKKYTK